MFFAAGVLAMLVSYFATRLTITLSLRTGALDLPNERSSHSEATPRLGGLGILAAAALIYSVFILMGSFNVVAYPVLTPDKMAMLGAGMAMAAIGLYDDFRHLRPAAKLLAQVVLAIAIVALGHRFETLPLAGWGPVDLGWATIPLTGLWLTGFSNTFNFIDGINGLSAVTAATYFFFFSAIAWFSQMPALVVLGVILAGSCVGFLPHNFPRARTFMGDSGSLPLGFTLAFFVVHIAGWVPEPEVVPALILVCSVSLWDTGLTLVLRILRGERILQPHRQHLYQRLVQLGHSHAKITYLYLVLHATMGCLSLAYFWWAPAQRVHILVFAFLILVGYTLMVYWLEQRAAKLRILQEGQNAGPRQWA